MKRPLRIALMSLAPVLLSGCESLPALTDVLPESGGDQVAAPTVAGERAARTGEETHELRQAIDLLQDGRLQQGREGLVGFLKRNPTNHTALSLLRQIDSDPTALLGKEHTLYTVRAGDTLGELADRFLGDALSFLALARYNDIQRPRVLHVGQTLRVPVGRVGDAAPDAPAEESVVEAADEPAMVPPAALESTVEPGEAPTDVDTAAAPGESSTPTEERATSAIEAATPDVETSTPNVEAAETAIDDVGPRFESAAPAARAATTPGADAGRIAQYHQAAIVHFRNQELDEAIGLWDRVLALDPGFEPAQGYRIRALELKRRLEALETP